VPEEIAKERQDRLRRAAQKQGRQPSEEVLYLTNWTIVLTNLPSKRATYSQVLVRLAITVANRTALSPLERKRQDRRVALV
jgi:hypothetical protein